MGQGCEWLSKSRRVVGQGCEWLSQSGRVVGQECEWLGWSAKCTDVRKAWGNFRVETKHAYKKQDKYNVYKIDSYKIQRLHTTSLVISVYTRPILWRLHLTSTCLVCRPSRIISNIINNSILWWHRYWRRGVDSRQIWADSYQLRGFSQSEFIKCLKVQFVRSNSLLVTITWRNPEKMNDKLKVKWSAEHVTRSDRHNTWQEVIGITRDRKGSINE